MTNTQKDILEQLKATSLNIFCLYLRERARHTQPESTVVTRKSARKSEIAVYHRNRSLTFVFLPVGVLYKLKAGKKIWEKGFIEFTDSDDFEAVADKIFA